MKISVKLIPNWRDVLRWAWSVRLFALSVLCDVLGIVFAVRGSFSSVEGASLCVCVDVCVTFVCFLCGFVV